MIKRRVVLFVPPRRALVRLISPTLVVAAHPTLVVAAHSPRGLLEGGLVKLA
jgi:hypothetical protein